MIVECEDDTSDKVCNESMYRRVMREYKVVMNGIERADDILQ